MLVDNSMELSFDAVVLFASPWTSQVNPGKATRVLPSMVRHILAGPWIETEQSQLKDHLRTS